VSWSIDPSEFADVMEKDLASLRTEVALRLHTMIVLRTAVDTGRARGSWAISYGSPVAQDIVSDSAGQAISRGVAQIAERADSAFEVVVISSNLPYIRRLEFDRWSKQSPQGMVRISIADIKARFSQ